MLIPMFTPMISLLVGMLTACGECRGDKCDPTECVIVDERPLSDVHEDDWPEGMQDTVAAWLATEGAWTLEVDCGAESDQRGPASLELAPCGIEELALRTWNDEESCQELGVVVCSDAGFSLVGENGWAEASTTAAGSLVGEKWEFITDNAHLWGTISGAPSTMSGYVELADRHCELESFRR